MPAARAASRASAALAGAPSTKSDSIATATGRENEMAWRIVIIR
jgi:hypothetical protein